MFVKVNENNEVVQYPYTYRMLKEDNPNTSFPNPQNMSDEAFAGFNMYRVSMRDSIDYDVPTQELTLADTPVLESGQWYINWVVVDLSEEEITNKSNLKAENQRLLRDEKLAETDFYALSDVTMSAEMTAYRQALRDITSHANWPHLEEADWPTKP